MALTNMDRLMKATIDLSTSNLSYNALEFYLPDSNIFNAQLSLKVGKTILSNADLVTGYNMVITKVKKQWEKNINIIC